MLNLKELSFEVTLFWQKISSSFLQVGDFILEENIKLIDC